MHFISTNQGGLGNRLKSLMSTMRLASQANMGVAVYWRPSIKACNCGFADLFVSDTIRDISSFDRQAYDVYDLGSGYDDYPADLYRITPPRSVALSTWRLVVLADEVSLGFAKRCPCGNGRNIDYEYNRIPHDVRSRYVALLAEVKPRKDIQDAVEKFAESIPANALSVSVRSWPEERRRSRYFKVERLFDELDRHRGRWMFISCDCPIVLDMIKTRYPERAVVLPRQTPPGERNTVRGMQEILIELLLLGTTDTMIVYSGSGPGRYFSTYSEAAWWFGGARSDVIVVD